MTKQAIGASLPALLFKEFIIRSRSFPGAKTGLIKESLRFYFEAHPLTPEEREAMQTPDPVEPAVQ